MKISNLEQYKDPDIITIDESLISRYKTYLDIAEDSVNTYLNGLKQFYEYLAEKAISSPKREDIIQYKKYLKEEKGLKANSIKIYIISVKRFFKWTEQEGYYPNIADEVKTGKVSNNFKKDALSSSQIRKIISKIDTKTVTGKRDYAIISLMATTGLRVSEVYNSNIGDIRVVGDDVVLFIQGKGKQDKQDYVKLSEEVEDAIRQYFLELNKVRSEDPLFVSLSNNGYGTRLTRRSLSGIAKKYMRKAGYDSSRLTAHSLRHSAATINLVHGGTLEETQQLLRHEDINTTMTYLHHIQRQHNKSEERISKAIFSEK